VLVPVINASKTTESRNSFVIVKRVKFDFVRLSFLIVLLNGSIVGLHSFSHYVKILSGINFFQLL